MKTATACYLKENMRKRRRLLRFLIYSCILVYIAIVVWIHRRIYSLMKSENRILDMRTKLPYLYHRKIYTSHTNNYTNIFKTNKYTDIFNTDSSVPKTGKDEEIYAEVFLFGDNTDNDTFFLQWRSRNRELCNKNFIGYNHAFAKLVNVEINPRLSHGPKGGEDLNAVIGQSEENEYLRLDPGFFNIKCNEKVIRYSFQSNDHLTEWITVTKTDITNTSRDGHVLSNFTVAVLRYEYANLYHTMTDWYNVYLMIVFYRMDPSKTDILFIDGHPSGGLDKVWNTLFGSVIRVGELEQSSIFATMIWNIMGYNSPLNEQSLSTVPLISSFRSFFLSRHSIIDRKNLNCKRLSILFIWRRNYVAHPRNPNGFISRKIKNEIELENTVRYLNPNFSISSVQTDNLTMVDQLNYIVNTDILIGMHGAGLTLALFLPSHASLIELYPSYFSRGNIPFKTIARWRKLQYISWQNEDEDNEFPEDYTYVPPKIVMELVKNMVDRLCPSSS